MDFVFGLSVNLKSKEHCGPGMKQTLRYCCCVCLQAHSVPLSLSLSIVWFESVSSCTHSLCVLMLFACFLSPLPLLSMTFAELVYHSFRHSVSAVSSHQLPFFSSLPCSVALSVGDQCNGVHFLCWWLSIETGVLQRFSNTDPGSLLFFPFFIPVLYALTFFVVLFILPSPLHPQLTSSQLYHLNIVWSTCCMNRFTTQNRACNPSWFV